MIADVRAYLHIKKQFLTALVLVTRAAFLCAKEYEKAEHLSRADVQDQLSGSVDDGGEGFTPEQVKYAMDHLPK